MSDVAQMKPLYNLALNELKEMLDTGSITDRQFIDKVMQIVITYVKLKNHELHEKMYNFTVARIINEDNIKGLKKSLKQLS